MRIVKHILKNSKLSFFFDENNHCVQVYIFHYQDVLDFSNDLIELPFVRIIGNALLITRLEEDNLEITGNIEKIEFQKTQKEE